MNKKIYQIIKKEIMDAASVMNNSNKMIYIKGKRVTILCR
ncbi:hypothetical protein J2Z42_002245 [Clostridium algifaecis]|uniref:Uncharacterized protein n=1 Tax=Clostridium algifaecis TaxID=1472040 RepID=A0ABS4KU06_9CLOT|nr:hypothetical protein [Clostridium algifaecis]